MQSFEIIPWQDADRDELTSIWHGIFEDSEAIIESFFSLLHEIGTGYAATVNGKVAGTAYVITDICYSYCESSIPLGLIYAVATLPEYRGNGIAAALCKKCAAYAKANGAEHIIVSPANDSLADYYSACIGTYRFFENRQAVIPAEENPSISFFALTAREYNHLREEYLQGMPHLSLSDSCIEYEKQICCDCGGGLFTADGYPLCGYIEEDRLVIKELLAPERKISPIAAALASWLDVDVADYYYPGTEGFISLATDTDVFSDDTVWNILFD